MSPYIIKTSTEISDHNQAIQVGPDSYSFSVHPDVFDNFPAHSCDPTMVPKARATRCVVLSHCGVYQVLLDLSVKFRAAHDIPPGSVLSFDYEETVRGSA